MTRALRVDEALARILAGAEVVTGTQSVGIETAAGRVLAKDLVSRLTQPPFDSSAMGGGSSSMDMNQGSLR